ncbi:MAG: hypothetical protein ACI4CC_01480 [Lachnospiraceae bacterium]
MRVYAYETEINNLRNDAAPNFDFFDSYEEANRELLFHKIKSVLLDWFFRAESAGAEATRIDLLLQIADADESLPQSRDFSLCDLLQDDSPLDVQVPDGGYVLISAPGNISICGYMHSKNLGEV